MRINLPDYVGKSVTTTITTAKGKFSGNVHCNNMLIGGVSGTVTGNLKSVLPTSGVSTKRATLVENGGKHFAQFDGDVEIEVVPLRMS